jgi:hypothetical protein
MKPFIDPLHSEDAKRFAQAHSLRPGVSSASTRDWFPNRETIGSTSPFRLWSDHSNRWSLPGSTRIVCVTGQPYRPRLASHAVQFAAELEWHRTHGFTVYLDRFPSWWNPPLTVLVEMWLEEFAPGVRRRAS